MLRYDIESALINGDIEPDAIPDMWESAMQDYLGLSVNGDHSKGCLQDIHWTDGAFGYFPSYTMGAVNAAQIAASIKQQCPDWQEHFTQGNMGFARNWLRENIWQHGSHFPSQGLMQQATGEGSTASHLIEHLKNRYLEEIDQVRKIMGFAGFDEKWKDFPDYIIGITKEIWEKRQINTLHHYYSDDIIVRTPLSLIHI